MIRDWAVVGIKSQTKEQDYLRKKYEGCEICKVSILEAIIIAEEDLLIRGNFKKRLK